MAPQPSCHLCGAPHAPGHVCPDLGEAKTVPAGVGGPIPLVHPVSRGPVGEQVGSFRIERLLGSGGMGAVYLGRHPAIGSEVAIKFLRPEYSAEPALVRRLYAEARAANLVVHENIVRILDLGQHPVHGFYLVMELVAGETLAARLQRGPVPLAWAEQVLVQVCSAVDAAHRSGVIHRDLKPENVMVVERAGVPQVKVMDFGIAKLRDAETFSGTQTGAILGTPAYIAPEQCDGRPVDARSDIYALGVMAFELVTGQTPFSGGAARLMIAHLTQPPPAPTSIRPDLPAQWESAILRALAKRPEERFASAGELAAALRSLKARSPPPSARPAEVRRRVSVAVQVQLAQGRPPVSLVAVDLSRGGALLAFEGEPPPVFSRVTLRLGPALEVAAEVVRHVGDLEARAWNTVAGFAVQFCSPGPELARRIDALVEGMPEVEPPQPPGGGALTPQQRMVLARYGAQATASYYDVLGLPLDATRTEIVEAGRRAVAELHELEQRPLTPAHADQVRASLQRVASAIATLSSVRERLQYDARRGNVAGIARAIAAGCSHELLKAERDRFLRERPDVPSRVEQLRARARLAQRQGKHDAADRERRAALELDPLDLELHLLVRGPGR